MATEWKWVSKLFGFVYQADVSPDIWCSVSQGHDGDRSVWQWDVILSGKKSLSSGIAVSMDEAKQACLDAYNGLEEKHDV